MLCGSGAAARGDRCVAGLGEARPREQAVAGTARRRGAGRHGLGRVGAVCPWARVGRRAQGAPVGWGEPGGRCPSNTAHQFRIGQGGSITPGRTSSWRCIWPGRTPWLCSGLGPWRRGGGGAGPGVGATSRCYARVPAGRARLCDGAGSRPRERRTRAAAEPGRQEPHEWLYRLRQGCNLQSMAVSRPLAPIPRNGARACATGYAARDRPTRRGRGWAHACILSGRGQRAPHPASGKTPGCHRLTVAWGTAARPQGPPRRRSSRLRRPVRRYSAAGCVPQARKAPC